jgi:polysaccharide export outer membrane protein
MPVIRRRSLLGKIAVGLLSLLPVPVVCGPASAQTAVQREGKVPPSELLQYIRNAKQQGVADSRIRQQARAIGWPAAVVDEAIAFEATAAKAPEAGPKAGETKNPDAAREEALRDHPPAGMPDDYQIGAGDTLQISVWKEPDVSVPSVVVRPDGRITVPLIKEVAVAGRTPREVEKLITEAISKFITDANVTVVVAAINSKKVYVVGAARKEGPLPYTSGLTVMQALSEAGGLTDYAKRKRMYVLRTENGREYRLDFNYDEVVKGERMEQNIFLLPGDTVIIPH